MYPALILTSRPERSSRLLLFLRPFMLIPHLFWAMLYGFAAQIVLFLSFWAIVFTGSHPESLWNFLCGYFRYASRVNGFGQLLTDTYPPFHGNDDTAYGIRISAQRPERMSRLNVFFRFLLVLPHIFFALFYSIGVGFILCVTFFAVLFTGRIPPSLWGILFRYFVYNSRLNAYTLLLVDEYPPFHGEQPLAAEVEFDQE